MWRFAKHDSPTRLIININSPGLIPGYTVSVWLTAKKDQCQNTTYERSFIFNDERFEDSAVSHSARCGGYDGGSARCVCRADQETSPPG